MSKPMRRTTLEHVTDNLGLHLNTLKYTDHQSTCKEQRMIIMSASSLRDGRSRPQTTTLVDMNRSDRVAGYEFAYDYVVNLMGEHGCGPSDPYTKGKHISRWFGSINRVSQRAMALLVEKRFYN
ncbi:hypothetical protein ANCDUO_17168, partial [Ancylostoma duodenale]